MIHRFEISTLPAISEIGGKAFSLVQSTQAGFPVPSGFVLPVSFFDAWLNEIKSSKEWIEFLERGDKDSCDQVKLRCLDLKLDTELRNELDAALNEIPREDGCFIVAVRSSSPEEDLATTSFAGGYETTLGITTPQAVHDAVISSFSSVFDYRVVQYKRQNHLPTDTPQIAVIIQQQIQSDVSGVAFSLNPQNNCYDEAVISANFGLGETVVSGLVTPDTYIVDKVKTEVISKKVAEKDIAYFLDKENGRVCEEKNKNPLSQALHEEQILKVSSLVTQVEEQQGRPVDIEWAIHDNQLFLLQARPVTTYIPLFPELITHPGEGKQLYMDIIAMSQGFSDPLSVLGMDIWGQMLIVSKPHLSHGEGGMVREIHGREYICISNLLKVTGGQKLVRKMMAVNGDSLLKAFESVNIHEYTPKVVPEKSKHFMFKFLSQLFKTLPFLIRGLFNSEKCLDKYLEVAKTIQECCQQDILTIDKTYKEEVDELMNYFTAIVPIAGAMISPWISKWILHRMFSGDKEMQDLLKLLDMDLIGNPTSEMGHWMLRLASFQEIQDTSTGEEFVQKINFKQYPPTILEFYDQYMNKFGCRGMKEIDVATPRTSEDPKDFFSRIKMIDIENNAIKTVTKRKEDAYEKLLSAATRMGKEKKFKRHAEVIKSLGGYREHPKYLYVVIVAYLRRLAMKLGKKFVEENRLEHVEQIFELTIEQISLAQKNSYIDLLTFIDSNKAPYKAVEHVKDWPALIDSRGRIIRPQRESADGLSGDPISSGVAKGRAKVLLNPYDKPLENGDILVAKATEPSWTPIFINAAGVVMEVGGPLQHGAIIAREYGIPCVSGVENATKIISDGCLIEVDGSNGVVKLIEEEVSNQ